jgi:hypothetical protein
MSQDNILGALRDNEKINSILRTAEKGVIAQSGVSASESSGDQIDVCYLNTIFELYPSYHLGQVLEAA